MKKITGAVFLLVLVLLLSVPWPVYARGGGHHLGGIGSYRGGGHVMVRGGHGWGWWPWAIGGAMVGSALAAHYYYPPAPVVIQGPPVVVQPEPQQDYYWYYCQNPQGYYPYVKNCPGGWMKVVPEANPPHP